MKLSDIVFLKIGMCLLNALVCKELIGKRLSCLEQAHVLFVTVPLSYEIFTPVLYYLYHSAVPKVHGGVTSLLYSHIIQAVLH